MSDTVLEQRIKVLEDELIKQKHLTFIGDTSRDVAEMKLNDMIEKERQRKNNQICTSTQTDDMKINLNKILELFQHK